MTVASRYQQDLARNEWHSDAAQQMAVEALDQLRLKLLEPPPSTLKRWLGAKAQVPQGLYLWGGVGRGKTYLMDLFYAELGNIPAMRQHFHRFMLDVHAKLHALKDIEDPLYQVATQLHQRARVICFDEFFVADVADAMILGRLFHHLFDLGTVLVATSNVPPDKLYETGLQRSQFLPAIEALKINTKVLLVDGGEDYRLRVLSQSNIYCWPHDKSTDLALEESFSRLAPDTGSRNAMMSIEGRKVKTIRRADGIVWFDFEAICDGPRGAPDYIEVARTFQTVIVSDTPQLTANLDNQARRFIIMVDEFYDRRVKLILSAAAPIERLYTGSRLAFEFQRTASRLSEMQSTEYLAQAHLP